MYNHGLGDCFLLTIHGAKDKKANMLIDCGLHGLQPGKREVFETVLKDIKEHIKGKDGKAVLDVVVATHQHYDHLSGFQIVGLKGDEFEDIKINELWLAWTENEEDAEAKNFQLAQKKKEQAMRMALSRIEKAGFDASYSEQFRYLLGFVYDEEDLDNTDGLSSLAMSGDSRGARKLDSNEQALKFLRDKAGKNKVRYMEPPVKGTPGKEPGNKPIDIGIEGVRIYVLGPPKQHAEEYLGSMDPRQGEGFGEHEGQAHLFPEEAAFLSALGVDSGGSGGGLLGSEKDYPFSKNYKDFHNPFNHNYLMSQKLQQVLKNNMGHLLRKLLCTEVERLGMAPLGETLMEGILTTGSEEGLDDPAINRGLSHLLLMKLKKALRTIWNLGPGHCTVYGYEVEDYEPDELKTPFLDEEGLDAIFRVQLQNHLAGRAAWAAESMESEGPGSLTFKDILSLLFTDWIRKAMKRLIEEVFMEFQNQQEHLTAAFKMHFFGSLGQRGKEDMERLFPAEQDKNDLLAFLMKKEVSIIELITDDEEGLESLLFQPGAEYLSSIRVRKRFKAVIDDRVVTGRGFSLMNIKNPKNLEEVKNLVLATTRQGLELKLKELARELKDAKANESPDAREENFLSRQDKIILLKHLSEGLPADLLEGLSPQDRIVLEYGNPSVAWRNIEQDWLRTAEIMALKLDSVRNNTSLVLAIELVGANKVLLFPGDAQAGNWRSWAEVEYEVDGKKVKAEDLLEKTVFYKVGHHGSHNATIKSGLDLMKSGELAAMIPVDQDVADKVGWEMPFAPLLEALLEKTEGRVAIADNKMDVSRLLKQLPKEHRTQEMQERLKKLKTAWEKGRTAFTASKELADTAEKRPLYFEYRVG